MKRKNIFACFIAFMLIIGSVFNTTSANDDYCDCGYELEFCICEVFEPDCDFPIVGDYNPK